MVSTIEEFHAVVRNPSEYVKKLKSENGKRVIGFFCSYTPEELIHAAGALPMRLFSSPDQTIAHADAHLQSYSCSLVRGALEEALTGRLDFLDGTVFPHTCDSIQRLSDIWRLNTPFSFFADVVLPVRLDAESARQYMGDVLNKFRSDLEKGLGVEISDEKIRESIVLYNEIRGKLRKLYELRSENPYILSGSDVYAVVRASMVLDRRELLQKLTELLNEAAEEKSVGTPNRKRIILTGGICNHPDVYTIIEESGGVVVWDDMCTGARYFDGDILTKGDPVRAIADRYFERVICPAKHATNFSRGEDIVRIAQENRADGVLFLLLKFCDPHAFDYPYMKAFLDKEGVPSMLLEVEDQLPSEGQLKTRFEAFIEML